MTKVIRKINEDVYDAETMDIIFCEGDEVEIISGEASDKAFTGLLALCVNVKTGYKRYIDSSFLVNKETFITGYESDKKRQSF